MRRKPKSSRQPSTEPPSRGGEDRGRKFPGAAVSVVVTRGSGASCETAPTIPVSPALREENLSAPMGTWRDCLTGRSNPHHRHQHSIPPPTLNTPRAVFSAFLPLLLLSGGIETNLGPTTKCPACNGFKWKQGSVICHQCGSWYHTIPKCSGVPNRTKTPLQWMCSKSQPPTKQPTTNPNPLPPPSPGPSGTQTPSQPPNSPTTPTQPTNARQTTLNLSPQNRKLKTNENSQCITCKASR